MSDKICHVFLKNWNASSLFFPKFYSARWIKQATKPRPARYYFFLSLLNPFSFNFLICIISLCARDLREKVGSSLLNNFTENLFNRFFTNKSKALSRKTCSYGTILGDFKNCASNYRGIFVPFMAMQEKQIKSQNKIGGNHAFLRASDRKYQKSHDRSEISDFILFHLNVPFGELFSKITIKSSSALSFF